MAAMALLSEAQCGDLSSGVDGSGGEEAAGGRRPHRGADDDGGVIYDYYVVDGREWLGFSLEVFSISA